MIKCRLLLEKLDREMPQFIEEVFENKKDITMTYGQFFKLGSFEKGIVIGKIEGGRNIAKNMLLVG